MHTDQALESLGMRLVLSVSYYVDLYSAAELEEELQALKSHHDDWNVLSFFANPMVHNNIIAIKNGEWKYSI